MHAVCIFMLHHGHPHTTMYACYDIVVTCRMSSLSAVACHHGQLTYHRNELLHHFLQLSHYHVHPACQHFHVPRHPGHVSPHFVPLVMLFVLGGMQRCHLLRLVISVLNFYYGRFCVCLSLHVLYFSVACCDRLEIYISLYSVSISLPLSSLR